MDSNDSLLLEKKRIKRNGLIWIFTPIIVLVFVLLLWGIIGIFGSTLGIPLTSEPVDFTYTNGMRVLDSIGSILNILMPIIMALSVIFIPAGLGLGIHFINKASRISGNYDDRSGKEDVSEIPDEIKGWNWGAFGVTFIWGIAHRRWIVFLMVIPFVNLIVRIIAGMKGNEWAWKSNKWQSIEEFKSVQNKWKSWGIAIMVLGILLNVLPFIL